MADPTVESTAGDQGTGGDEQTLGAPETDATVATAPENGEAQADPEKSEDAKPKEQDKVEKRISNLVRQRGQAREERDLARAEVARLKEMLETPAKPRDAFQSEDDFLEDRFGRINAKQALPSVEQRANAAETAHQQVMAQSWHERAAVTRAKYPDYDQRVVGNTQPVAPHVEEALLDSPVGPDLAYQLASDPDTLKLLNRLTPREVDRYLVRMEMAAMQGSTIPTPAPATVQAQTNVPPPAASPKSTGAPGAPRVRNGEGLTGEAYLKWYREEQARKRAKR
jgi:hypothetical protein